MLLAAAAISMFNVSFLVALFVLAVLPILLLSIRRRSLSLGVYSLASWLVSAIGMVDGFFRQRVDPRVPLQYTVLK